MKFIALLVCVALGAVLLVATSDLPDWGDPQSPASVHLSRYYIENSMEQTSVPNFVTAVLADYRGYDTMFETAVIFCAGITVLTILRRSHRRKKKDVKPRPSRSDQDIILQSAARLIVPMMQLFALYVLAHGHHSPGGGFQGGAIAGASFILLAISYDLKMVLNQIKERVIMFFSGLGVFIYAGIGIICLFLGGNFLDYSRLSKILPATEVEARSHGMLGIEIGVFITVTFIIISLYADLASGGEMDEGL
ncbi:MAG: sodium:proton antiporter [Desulfocapsa sp.]|nr:sodium:proton antiporter [Desulfocapsa sp.]MBN4060037.1 sodium:proton antiporter [Desulfotalea psychrophila]